MTELPPLSAAASSPAAPAAAWAGPSDAQRHADSVVAEAKAAARRSLFRPPPSKPAPLAASSDPLDTRLAEELACIRRMLDALGEQLAADPATLNRHAHAMQGFDRIGQMLDQLAAIVAAEDRGEAIARATPDLRTRLQRRALFAA